MCMRVNEKTKKKLRKKKKRTLISTTTYTVGSKHAMISTTTELIDTESERIYEYRTNVYLYTNH